MKTILLAILSLLLLSACGEPLTLEQVRAKEEWCEGEGGVPKYSTTRKNYSGYPLTVNCEIEGLMYRTDHIQ